ncbi:hypothetical protein EVB39_092 [Rhizobium phage RHph_TM3_3_9]|nr:hypothetical protein EVB39_092 [Rhizobium phage RHph_TM3_3_9]QIG68613.1 hypothetical protein EVB66_092 [Rhizobium phage RHph_TM3_3_13]
MLKNNLEPTDFADSEVRVTEIMPFDGHGGAVAYRIWICRCTHHWFQRHEWFYEDRNQSEFDKWIYNGHHYRKEFDKHLIESPILD